MACGGPILLKASFLGRGIGFISLSCPLNPLYENLSLKHGQCTDLLYLVLHLTYLQRIDRVEESNS